MYVNSCWMSNPGVSKCLSSYEKFAYELFLTSPSVLFVLLWWFKSRAVNVSIPDALLGPESWIYLELHSSSLCLFFKLCEVQTNRGLNIARAWKNISFNLLERSDLQIIVSLSILEHIFLSVDIYWHRFLKMIYCCRDIWINQVILLACHLI